MRTCSAGDKRTSAAAAANLQTTPEPRDDAFMMHCSDLIDLHLLVYKIRCERSVFSSPSLREKKR